MTPRIFKTWQNIVKRMELNHSVGRFDYFNETAETVLDRFAKNLPDAEREDMLQLVADTIRRTRKFHWEMNAA